jgi:hypothetical protein
MGGGFSDNFTGTIGAIGEYRQHQISLLDKFPIRSKPNALSSGTTGNIGAVSAKKLKQCSCCGECTIATGTENEVCPICGWIDDKFQNKHPDSLNGKNAMTLNEARKRFHTK